MQPQRSARHPARRPIPWRWLFALCALAVLVLSLLPPATPLPSTGWDKSNHLLGFAVLAWLGLRAYPRRIAAVLLGLIVYGGVIEVLQSFTPYRFADWIDLVADGLGVGMGYAVWRLAARFFGPDATTGGRVDV
jgi:VanZ family protein